MLVSRTAQLSVFIETNFPVFLWLKPRNNLSSIVSHVVREPSLSGKAICLRVTSVQTHESLGILVGDPGYTECGCDLEQVHAQAFVHAADTLIPVCLPEYVPNAGVGGRVHLRALSLQTSSQHIQRVYHGRTKGPRGGTDNSCRQVAWQRILLVNAQMSRLCPRVCSLQKFESAHIDGTVREHADETHGDSPIGSAEYAILDHIPRSLHEQGIACQPAFYGLALKPELQSVEWIHAES